jgi:hypothetical protein
MGGDPLAGCVGKVERANLHLQALHAEISPFLKSEPKPYRFVSKVDVETSRYVLLVVIERKPPIEWSLIAGDFVQNLRAALDHLVWQLVRANGLRPTGGNAFPLFDQAPPKKRSHPERLKWDRMLRGVHPAAVRLIEICQPYNGADGPSRHVLAALRKLSNEDKHRTLIPAFSAVEARPDRMNLEVVGVRDVRAPIEGGKVHTGYALKSYDLVLETAVEITGPNPEVKLEGNLPLDIGFGWKPVPLQGFVQMCKAVALTISQARSFLGE